MSQHRLDMTSIIAEHRGNIGGNHKKGFRLSSAIFLEPNNKKQSTYLNLNIWDRLLLFLV